MSFIDGLKRWWYGLFPRKDIEQALQVSVSISAEMQRGQELWRMMFRGEAPWNDEDTPSLQIASAICTETARAVTLEFASEITGSPRADYLNIQYQRLVDDIRQSTEKACAGGMLVFRPYIREGQIHVTPVENNCYYPLKYNELGELTGVVFADTIARDKKYDTLLEKCLFDKGTYTIEYRAWVSDNPTSLGRETPLATVEEWAELPPVLSFSGIKFPWFSVFKLPQLNHIEQNSPQGVAIYSKAIELIKRA